MLDSRTPDLSLNKSRVAKHATMPLRPLYTKIISIDFVDPILALLDQNNTFLCDCVILGFYRSLGFSPARAITIKH